jgi:predicted PurR-regulated permease PerM
VAAACWRLLVVGALCFFALRLMARLEFVAISMFVGLVITALVGPLVNLLDRVMPRALAVALGLLIVILGVLGIFTFIGAEVAGLATTLASQFRNGITEIEDWLRQGPLHWDSNRITEYTGQLRTWITTNRATFCLPRDRWCGHPGGGLTGMFLAIFAAIFFLAGGAQIWDWILMLVGKRQRPRVDGSGHVAWHTFAGYTRGILVVAATNAVLVGIGLTILGVPLSLPLALLVFFGSFIPIVGAPIAMIVAAIVALAADGPLVALGVIVMIALIGQFEGHVLQPLVMARAVSIHPLAVALSVAAGTVLAGIVGAVVAVPVVSVLYAVGRFWVQTTPRNHGEERRGPHRHRRRCALASGVLAFPSAEDPRNGRARQRPVGAERAAADQQVVADDPQHRPAIDTGDAAARLLNNRHQGRDVPRHQSRLGTDIHRPLGHQQVGPEITVATGPPHPIGQPGQRILGHRRPAQEIRVGDRCVCHVGHRGHSELSQATVHIRGPRPARLRPPAPTQGWR